MKEEKVNNLIVSQDIWDKLIKFLSEFTDMSKLEGNKIKIIKPEIIGFPIPEKYCKDFKGVNHKEKQFFSEESLKEFEELKQKSMDGLIEEEFKKWAAKEIKKNIEKDWAEIMNRYWFKD
jgi:hypothetical protein